jgi:hypothetical protein
MTWDQLIALFGLIANGLMAGVAVIGVTIWRKQLRGASQHQTALRVSKAAFATTDAVARALEAGRVWSNRDLTNAEDIETTARDLNHGLTLLTNVREELRECWIEVQALWGRDAGSYARKVFDVISNYRIALGSLANQASEDMPKAMDIEGKGPNTTDENRTALPPDKVKLPHTPPLGLKSFRLPSEDELKLLFKEQAAFRGDPLEARKLRAHIEDLCDLLVDKITQLSSGKDLL